MIKLVYCVRKRDDVSTDDFYNYWLNKHGPLVKSCSESLRIKKYVQSHTVANDFGSMIVQQRGMVSGYDGVSEVWFDSLEAFQEVLSTDEGRQANAALAADEEKFIDLDRSTIFFTEENVVVG